MDLLLTSAPLLARGAATTIYLSVAAILLATALGLTKRKTFAIVVLPQAIRKVVPSLSNQGILIIKDTSLAATISVAELTFQARLLADRTAAVFEIFFTLALFYLALTAIFGGAMRLVERRVRIA